MPRVHICDMSGGPFETPPPTTDACLPHTPQPVRYVAHSEWAEEMAKTHDQQQCPGCGLWAIWTPRKDRVEG